MLIIIIHWPCHCTVHVYVVIHICDSMWSFWVKACFLSFVYICIAIEDPVIKREGWGSINRFNPATFLFLFPSQDLSYWCHMSWSFLCSVSSVKMRGDCSFCWYWQNWWPSLFNLSFHNCRAVYHLLHQYFNLIITIKLIKGVRG